MAGPGLPGAWLLPSCFLSARLSTLCLLAGWV